MNSSSMESFAREWADAWNRRAIEDVLAHFHDDVVFTSPTALAVTGAATVRGKPALREYWHKAMAKITSLAFAVDHVFWHEARREIAIVYLADVNGSRKRVSENLRFDAAGRVIAAEVFHGAPEVVG